METCFASYVVGLAVVVKGTKMLQRININTGSRKSEGLVLSNASKMQ